MPLCSYRLQYRKPRRHSCTHRHILPQLPRTFLSKASCNRPNSEQHRRLSISYSDRIIDMASQQLYRTLHSAHSIYHRRILLQSPPLHMYPAQSIRNHRHISPHRPLSSFSYSQTQCKRSASYPPCRKPHHQFSDHRHIRLPLPRTFLLSADTKSNTLARRLLSTFSCCRKSGKSPQPCPQSRTAHPLPHR